MHKSVASPVGPNVYCKAFYPAGTTLGNHEAQADYLQ
jgi:hypothetical protein